MESRRAVSLRAIALGGAIVVITAAFSRYNDAAAANTKFIHNALPTGPTALLLGVMLLVVGPLSRWRPAWALSRGELATVVAIVLLGCAVPGEGLMRWLPGVLTSIWTRGTFDATGAEAIRAMDLPAWPFPRFAGDDPAMRGDDPVIAGMLDRATPVPWAAWGQPAWAWALLLVPLATALLCGAAILRRQWAENERLPFPLAGVYLDLIEPPAAGRWLNRTLASRPFWAMFAAVFVLHGWRALNPYSPQLFPMIPLEFDLRTTWAGTALGATDETMFQQARLYGGAAAIAMLIPPRLAGSLVVCFLFTQIERVWLDGYGLDVPQAATFDRTLGGLLVYGTLAVVVARRHLGTVARQMVRGRRTGEPGGVYVPYSLAGWGFVLGVAGTFAWLLAAGCDVVAATVTVALVLLALLATAKIVAATGLAYAFVPAFTDRGILLARDLGLAATPRGAFWANAFNGIFGHDLRQGLPTLATHAMRVADPTPAAGPRLAVAAVAFLLLATAVSGVASLVVSYGHAYTLDRDAVSPIDPFGTMNMGKFLVMNPAMDYARDLDEAHNRPANVAGGGAATALCGYLSLRFNWWPLHPLGPLLAYTWPLKRFWLSLLAGWIAKLVLLRLRGAAGIAAARPAILGVIVGEAFVGAFWIAISLALLALGRDYYPYAVMPG